MGVFENGVHLQISIPPWGENAIVALGVAQWGLKAWIPVAWRCGVATEAASQGWPNFLMADPGTWFSSSAGSGTLMMPARDMNFKRQK